MAHRYLEVFELVLSFHCDLFSQRFPPFQSFFHRAVELVNAHWLRFKPTLIRLQSYCQVERWVWFQNVFWAFIFVGFVNVNGVSFSRLGGFVLIHTYTYMWYIRYIHKLIPRVFSSSSLVCRSTEYSRYCFPSLSDLTTTSPHRSSLYSLHPRKPEQTFHQSFRFARRRKYLCRNLVVDLKIPSCFSRRLICEWKGKRARCCDGNFLLAEPEVVMTTVISSHVKDKNCIFTGYQIFVTGEILVFHRCLYSKTIFIHEDKCLSVSKNLEFSRLKLKFMF